MWVIAIVFLLLILFLLWLLFSSITLCIDTRKNLYQIELLNLLRSWPCLEDGQLIINVKVPFYHFKIDPFETSEDKPKRVKEKKRYKVRRIPKFPMSRIGNVLRSFRVRAFELTVDTDDYVLNAKLTPVVYLLRSRNLDVSVNFKGESYGYLELNNSIWRMGTAFLGIIKY